MTTDRTLPVKILIVIFCIGLAALGYVFSDGLAFMVEKWERDEYSHGYMIPLVTLFLLYQNFPEIQSARLQPSWLGLLIVALGLVVGILGELSSIYTLVQYASLVCLGGLIIGVFGLQLFKAVWLPLLYLVFMIPLPPFLYNNLSGQLQLISSVIGVEVTRLFGISVYLEGNVIDLGNYQLQVVEACSGLRYLFPLMSFGFLIAYLYRGPFWHKAILFLATIPITVLMNSFRIGVIGVTVEHWGIEAAEGFLHDFEGWVVFMACLAVLAVIAAFLHRFVKDGRPFIDRINLDLPSIDWKQAANKPALQSAVPIVGVVSVLLVAVPLMAYVENREEVVPQRQQFTQFPLIHKGWIGREDKMETKFLDALKLTDYALISYRNGSYGLPVNLYVAYYATQHKGASIHSPRTCLPGGGWRLTDFGQKELDSIAVSPTNGSPLTVNRAIIKHGEAKQLVYYWFEQRGRNITNEYMAKWFIFWDSLTQKRTDGALVRVISQIPPNANIEDIEKSLQQFVADFRPVFPKYIPGEHG